MPYPHKLPDDDFSDVAKGNEEFIQIIPKIVSDFFKRHPQRNDPTEPGPNDQFHLTSTPRQKRRRRK